MTNNDDLAQHVRLAAEHALDAWNKFLSLPDDVDLERGLSLYEMSLLSAHDTASNPANILALLAERDADKKRIAQLEATEAHRQREWNEAHEQESRAEARELQMAEINDALCKLLPDCRYMDPPDGGSVTPLEQVSRMVADYRNRIAELEARDADKAENVQLRQRVAELEAHVDSTADFETEIVFALVGSGHMEPDVTVTQDALLQIMRGALQSRAVSVPTFEDYQPHIARELQAAFRIACADAGINLEVEE